MDVPDNFRAPDAIPVLESPMSTGMNRDGMSPEDFGTLQMMPMQEQMSSPRQPDVEKPTKRKNEEEVADVPADNPCNCCIAHGQHIDEESVMKHGHWVWYCCCMGFGWMTETHSPARFAMRCLCCQFDCERVPEVSIEGCCSTVHECCCMATVYQFPPVEGVPNCILCQHPLCGIHRTERTKPKDPTERNERHHGPDDPYTLYENIVLERWVPIYCRCMGCATVADPTRFC